MIISTYDQNGQAKCPTCKKVVNIRVVSGNMIFHPKYLEMYHKECKTQWKNYFETGKVEVTC